MCLGIVQVHTQCRHIKGFVPLEFCPLYNSGQSNCEPVYTHTTYIRAPALCLLCFRAEEAIIDAKYDGQFEFIERTVADYTYWLANDTMLDEEREMRTNTVESLLKRKVEWKARRKEEIATFRKQQGVWADG